MSKYLLTTEFVILVNVINNFYTKFEFIPNIFLVYVMCVQAKTPIGIIVMIPINQMVGTEFPIGILNITELLANFRKYKRILFGLNW